MVVRVIIAAGDISLKAESWFERRAFKGKAGIGRCRPCLNVAASEAAKLGYQLKVVVPTGFVPPNPGAQGVPEFVRCALVEARVLPVQAEVVKVSISSR